MMLENELRHELQGVLVPYDPARADEMTRVAMQAALLDARRHWQTPALATAAAVVVVGGGTAALAAGQDGGGATAPREGGTSTASTSASSPVPSQSRTNCGRTGNVQSCLAPCLAKLHEHGTVRVITLSIKPGTESTGDGYEIECGPAR